MFCCNGVRIVGRIVVDIRFVVVMVILLVIFWDCDVVVNEINVVVLFMVCI